MRSIVVLFMCSWLSMSLCGGAIQEERSGDCPRARAFDEAVSFLKRHQPDLRLGEVEPGYWEQLFEEPEWPEAERFFSGWRFLVYPESFFRRKSDESFHVLIVDPSCHVDHLDRRLKQVVGHARVRVTSEADVEALAKLLLRLHLVTSVYGEGNPDGLNIIDRLDDIEFKDEAERLRLSQGLTLEPPSIRREPDGFVWSFMSWDRVGSGDIAKNQFRVDFQGGVQLERSFIARNVGRWVPLR